MGSKVHPYRFRLPFMENYKSTWYARFNNNNIYSLYINQDHTIRQALNALFFKLLKNKKIKVSHRDKPNITEISIKRNINPSSIYISINVENIKLLLSTLYNLKTNIFKNTNFSKNKNKNLSYNLNTIKDKDKRSSIKYNNTISLYNKLISNSIPNTISNSNTKSNSFSRPKKKYFSRFKRFNKPKRDYILLGKGQKKIDSYTFRISNSNSSFYPLTNSNNNTVRKINIVPRDTLDFKLTKESKTNINPFTLTMPIYRHILKNNGVHGVNYNINKKYVSNSIKKANSLFCQYLKVKLLNSRSSFYPFQLLSHRDVLPLCNKKRRLPQRRGYIRELQRELTNSKAIKGSPVWRKLYSVSRTSKKCDLYRTNTINRSLKNIKQSPIIYKNINKRLLKLYNKGILEKYKSIRNHFIFNGYISNIDFLSFAKSLTIYNSIKKAYNKTLKVSISNRNYSTLLTPNNNNKYRGNRDNRNSIIKKNIYKGIKRDGFYLPVANYNYNSRSSSSLIEYIKNNLKKYYQSSNLSTKFLEDIKIKLLFYSKSSKITKAVIYCTKIVEALEKREPFRKVIKKYKSLIISTKGVKGVKISVSGRLNGAELARTEWVKQGRIPLGTISANIDYSFKEALTIYGIIGVKVWIYKV